MAAVGCIAKVCNSCVGRAAVIPQYDRARAPSHSGLELGAFLDVVVEKLEDGVALLLLEADDLSAELPVDEQSLLPGDRVSADERMDVLHGLSLDDTSSAASASMVRLRNTGVQNRQRLEILSERNRQLLISRSLVGVACAR